MSKHKPCGFGYHIVCFDDKLYSLEPVIYRADNKGEDVVQMFIKMLEVNLKNTHKELDFAEKMSSIMQHTAGFARVNLTSTMTK